MGGPALAVQHFALHLDLRSAHRREVLDVETQRVQPLSRHAGLAQRVEHVEAEEVDVGGREAAEEIPAWVHDALGQACPDLQPPRRALEHAPVEGIEEVADGMPAADHPLGIVGRPLLEDCLRAARRHAPTVSP